MYSKNRRAENDDVKTRKGHDFQGEKVSERVRDGRNNKIRQFFF